VSLVYSFRYSFTDTDNRLCYRSTYLPNLESLSPPIS